MYDSRQFLQFMVDRRLGFDPDRNRMFNAERNLIFNPERNLLFDCDRGMYFGKVGPVFRGQACPQCKNLVHPLEDTCRHCGTHVVPLRQVVPTKQQYATQPRRKTRVPEGAPQPMVRREVRAQQVAPQQVQVVEEGAKQVCPNCSLKIPADAVYCPRCRVKLDEWRKYIQDLRRWEAEQARSAQYGTDRFYDVPSRRRR